MRNYRELLAEAAAPRRASYSPRAVCGATHSIWPMLMLDGLVTSGFNLRSEGREQRKRWLSPARVSPRPTRYMRRVLQKNSETRCTRWVVSAGVATCAKQSIASRMHSGRAISAHMFPTTSRLLSVKMRSGSASSVFMLNSRRQFESPANTCAMYCNVSPLAPQYLPTCGKRR